MTFRTDPEFDDDQGGAQAASGGWITAALAVSVLIIATVSLTIFATGAALPVG